jgi:endonuclease III
MEQGMDTRGDILKKVRRLFLDAYHREHHFNKDKVFDEILFIFFSWRTPIVEAESIYQELRSTYSDWNELFRLGENEWFTLLESGGKARDKARIIVRLLQQLHEDFGAAEGVERLAEKTDLEIQHYLTSLPGIKDKSAYCIMLYAMKKPVFPADAHCLRISQRLGIIEGTNKSKQDRVRGQKELNTLLKGDYQLCYDLHITMIQHGKLICKTKPLCEKCVISALCEYRKGGEKICEN